MTTCWTQNEVYDRDIFLLPDLNAVESQRIGKEDAQEGNPKDSEIHLLKEKASGL